MAIETPVTRPRDGLGLQSRLTIAFGTMLTLAIGFCCIALSVLHFNRTERSLTDRLRQIGDTTALAVTSDTDGIDTAKTAQLAEMLLLDRDVIFVGFFNPEGELGHASSTIAPKDEALRQPPVLSELARPSRQRVPGVPGEVVEITLPILRAMPGSETRRLLGYTRIVLSSAREMAYLRETLTIMLAVGCIMMCAALPMSWWLVRKLLGPIQAVAFAARRIAEGNLDVRVPVGGGAESITLARAFNDMVRVVANQRLDLQDVNGKLARANEELEGRIAHRTLQLETANCRLTNEIAEKEDFLRAVSHDLNAPLRNIDGIVAMLMTKHAEAFEPEVMRRLERVRANVKHETDLIGELLELSRIKTRRGTMEEVDLEQMVWELRGLFENDLRERNITLRLESKLPKLWAEKARIRQIMQNLIDNAIKYMGDSIERQIRIGCRLRNDEAEFYVTDTGMGIDADDAAKVFHVFRRGKSAGAVAGKGVGLASVKSIVENYSGIISASGKLGVGTTFTFTINGQYVPALGGGRENFAGTDDEDEPDTSTPAETAPSKEAA